MRRLVAAMIVGFALAALGGASAKDVDWKSLRYFDYSGQQLLITTDGSWVGAKAVNAGRFEPGGTSIGVFESRGIRARYIWAPKCTPGKAQFVSFSNDFRVPGVPLRGDLNFTYGPGNQFYGDRPYRSALVLVNGTEVARLGNIATSPRTTAPAVGEPLSDRDLHAFEYGTNSITIRVDRAPLKKNEPCNNDHVGRYIGVFATLHLQFASDLRVLPPRVPRVVKKNVANGASEIITGTVQVANEGPSHSLEGHLDINIAGGVAAQIIKSQKTGPETTYPLECKPYDSKKPAFLECPYRKNFRPSAEATVTYIFRIVANHGYFRNGAERIVVNADVGGIGPDPKNGNNHKESLIILCAPGATDPACR